VILASRAGTDVGALGAARRNSQRNERAVAIGDLGLRQFDLQLFLNDGEISQDRDGEVLEDPLHRAGTEGEMLLLPSGLHDIERNGAPLRLVAIKKKIGIADTLEYIGEFPGEIDGVLNACVHALSAGRAVDVRGVAGKEAASHPIARHHAFVDAEGGKPARIAQTQAGRAVAVGVILQFSERQCHVAIRVARAHGEDPPRFPLEGEQRDGATAAPPEIDIVVIQAAAVDTHIAEQKGLRFGIAFKSNP
jgi:hypothetical protein